MPTLDAPLPRTARPSLRSTEERNALAMENQYLVQWTLKRFFRGAAASGWGDDLIAQGHLGLLKAAAHYDHQRGTFSNFAVRLIRQFIARHIRATDGVIYLSPSIPTEKRQQ